MVDPDQAPRNKHDVDRIYQLFSLPISRWQHLIPELLTWLQDRNWPIFKPVRDLLLINPEGCIAPLVDILDTSDDSMWHFWILYGLVAHMPSQCWAKLEPSLRRLKERTGDDALWKEAVDEEVDEVLERLRRSEQ